MLTALQQTM